MHWFAAAWCGGVVCVCERGGPLTLQTRIAKAGVHTLTCVRIHTHTHTHTVHTVRMLHTP